MQTLAGAAASVVLIYSFALNKLVVKDVPSMCAELLRCVCSVRASVGGLC